MKKKIIHLVIFILINTALFYLLPLLIHDTGMAMMVLLVLIPLLCFIVAVIYGALNSFNILYSVLVALVFTPTIWIFYNESAGVYIPIYGGIALIGNLIGMGIYKLRKSVSKDNSEQQNVGDN